MFAHVTGSWGVTLTDVYYMEDPNHSLLQIPSEVRDPESLKSSHRFTFPQTLKRPPSVLELKVVSVSVVENTYTPLVLGSRGRRVSVSSRSAWYTW